MSFLPTTAPQQPINVLDDSPLHGRVLVTVHDLQKDTELCSQETRASWIRRILDRKSRSCTVPLFRESTRVGRGREERRGEGERREGEREGGGERGCSCRTALPSTLLRERRSVTTSGMRPPCLQHENCDELLSIWLVLVKGTVCSEGLPSSKMSSSCGHFVCAALPFDQFVKRETRNKSKPLEHFGTRKTTDASKMTKFDCQDPVSGIKGGTPTCHEIMSDPILQEREVHRDSRTFGGDGKLLYKEDVKTLSLFDIEMCVCFFVRRTQVRKSLLVCKPRRTTTTTRSGALRCVLPNTPSQATDLNICNRLFMGCGTSCCNTITSCLLITKKVDGRSKNEIIAARPPS